MALALSARALTARSRCASGHVDFIACGPRCGAQAKPAAAAAILRGGRPCILMRPRSRLLARCALRAVGVPAAAANRRDSRPRPIPAHRRRARTGKTLAAHGQSRTAIGWPAGVTPTPAAGFAVNAFATGLEHPRWLYVLPNGDVLVAETNRPPTPDPPSNPIRGALMKSAIREGRRRRAEPEPHHAAARRATATASPKRARCSCRT